MPILQNNEGLWQQLSRPATNMLGMFIVWGMFWEFSLFPSTYETLCCRRKIDTSEDEKCETQKVLLVISGVSVSNYYLLNEIYSQFTVHFY
jgi:hypothetical protein